MRLTSIEAPSPFLLRTVPGPAAAGVRFPPHDEINLVDTTFWSMESQLMSEAAFHS